jgi:hypothetical protein
MARGKYIKCESTILEALDGSAFEELRDEMTEWRDNMEGTGLESTDKFQAVSECADALENAAVEEKAQEVEDSIEEALQGKPFKAGCPEHVEGQKCKRCGWDGKRRRWWRGTPELILFDEVKEHFGESFLAQVREGNCFTYFKTHEEAREYQEKKVQESKDWEAKNAIPHRIRDEAELEPCQVIEECIADRKISWHEFRKYGKQALNLSRSDRMSNASAALRAAIDEIREALEEHKGEERVDIVLEQVDELEGALEEVEGVEFPGMYG